MKVLIRGWAARLDEGGRDIYASEPEDLLLALKNIRDILLNECDFTLVPDSPLSEEDKNAWIVFRQELRDFPSQFTVENITPIVDFPNPPLLGRPKSWVNLDPDVVQTRYAFRLAEQEHQAQQ